MGLKAKAPEAAQLRFKMLLFGEPGSGKTTTAIQFPTPYIIDAERGTSNYKALIDASKGAVLQTTDIDEVIGEVRALATESHEYRTLVIDPSTMLEADLMEKSEKLYGLGDMRIWAARDRVLKRLLNLLYKLDMNVIVIAHGKIDYGDNMKKLGTTFDGWKRWPFAFDLSLELVKQAGKRKAIVRKTRLEKFPDGEMFDASYAEIAKRFDAAVMEKKAGTLELASKEQVAELRRLLSVVSIDESIVNTWLTKAGAEQFEDMQANQVAGCIDYVQKKIKGAA